QKILLFLIANALGFLSVGICFWLGVLTHVIDLSDPAFDAKAFQTHFVTGTILTWAVCAVLSLGWFFFRKGKLRFVFLLAPAIAPLIYGLSTLYRLSL